MHWWLDDDQRLTRFELKKHCMVLWQLRLMTDMLSMMHSSPCIGVTVQGSEGQLLLLRLACSANSHARHVVLHRQHGSSLWPPFNMTVALHDGDSVSGAFITCVDAPAKQLGLRTGDQVRFRSDFCRQKVRLC